MLSPTTKSTRDFFYWFDLVFLALILLPPLFFVARFTYWYLRNYYQTPQYEPKQRKRKI
jgi:hypothetical protein